LTVQACSSGSGAHPLSFRNQAVEITSIPEGAEFYLADGQQSPLAIANKAATIISRTALHPFGHVRFQTGKSGDPWGFVGNEEDRGSGISDFHARPYRPELGVFLAVDPVALLSPEQTIGNATRLFAYVYAGSDPITQADGNGLTFGQFVHGMWDQGVENVKAAAQATVASVRSNAALAMSGDIEGAATNIAIGAAHGMIQTVKDVGNFGSNFVKAVSAPNDYEAGRLAVKPVMTAMTVAAAVMGTRVGSPKSGVGKLAKAESNVTSERTISVYHGSIKDGANILEHGLQPSRGTAFVSRDIGAANDALLHHPEAMPGKGMIVESRIPESQFNATLAPLERGGYHGFYPYNLNTTEITLREPAHFEVFNQNIVK
jgi:RHS repeat-associated protein